MGASQSAAIAAPADAAGLSEGLKRAEREAGAFVVASVSVPASRYPAAGAAATEYEVATLRAPDDDAETLTASGDEASVATSSGGAAGGAAAAARRGVRGLDDDGASSTEPALSLSGTGAAAAAQRAAAHRAAAKRAAAAAVGERSSSPSSASSAGLVAGSVWHSYSNFVALHAAVEAELAITLHLQLPAPAPRGLASSAADAADATRCLLEDYLRALVRHPAASHSLALRAFLRPALRPDWPPALGAIDLRVHDGPHASSATEWWYFNTHFELSGGRQYSLFVAFFRVVIHIDAATGARSHAHAVSWALSDVANKSYVHEGRVDKDIPAIAVKFLEGGGVIKDGRLREAYLEVLRAGKVPLPDRIFTAPEGGRVAPTGLDLDFEAASLRKNEATGAYELRFATHDGAVRGEFSLQPRKAPVRHGVNGVIKGHSGDDMFYYCITRADVTGWLATGGPDAPAERVERGQGWYDHEFGGVVAEGGELPLMNYAWDWAAVQLDNGAELSVSTLSDPRTKPPTLMDRGAVLIGADGASEQTADVIFTPIGKWTSVRTFSSYPTGWRIAIPSQDIDLTLTASFPDQEFVTVLCKPAFWEGRVAVAGTWHGARVTGVGYVERNGWTTLSALDDFFRAVGEATRQAVADAYPLKPTFEHAVELIASRGTERYLEGVDLDVFAAGIVAPVRYITDQGGKSWRSYGALACVDVVGGDSRKFTKWLAMPEFIHVGSLIIDDIEDGSEKRRGAPCAHVKYGTDVAINSGTAAYFQTQQLLLARDLPPAVLNRVYDLYFAALRAGHAGQALDIAGLHYMMDDAIASGNGALLESRVLAIHRLKTAVPAASLARMGAVVGGGTEEQIDAVGRYYEAVGLAFQIMDDVLNLRGLYTGSADKKAGVELKNLGEDIAAGKVTIPVAKALSRLPREEMASLWAVVKTKPQERAVIDDVIARLEACGAIDACVTQATEIVDGAFAVMSPLIPDSFSKIMLRAFGHFVIGRGY